jgi:CheY-like chemotaxis protein
MQLVAVMFTDLVQSTLLYARLGPRRAAALRESHFHLLRDLADAHGGHVVKTLGDGVMAIFTSVNGSLLAARAMQRAAGESGVSLRVGISAGDSQQEGEDWNERPVVEAARICASAAAGQILVSDSALQLAPRNQHHTRPLGTAEFNGLEPLALHELSWLPGPETPMRLVIGDDAALFREGLARLLDASGRLEVVGQAADGAALLSEVRRVRPDLVIADMRMPPLGERTGLAVLDTIRREHPGTAVVLLSARVETAIAAELSRSGARRVGYLHKERVGDVSDFISALRAVAAGGQVLDREVVPQPAFARSLELS